jgi:hypothetical protein
MSAALERCPSQQRSTVARFSVLLVLPWLLSLLLFASNVATVVSEKVHAVAFDAVAALVSLAGNAVASAVLERSPTKTRARAVADGTRQVALERDEIRARHLAVSKEHEAVKASRAALAQEHEALRATAAKRASAVRSLATRSNTVLATRSAEAVTSLPLRAAPYIGIGALVAFTTLELQADCTLAKDLAALNADHGNEPIDTGAVCRTVEKVPSREQAWKTVKESAGTAWRGTYEVVEVSARKLGLSLNSGQAK